MFKSFFASRRYLFWAWPGVVLIVSGIACQVQIDVALNSGVGELFDVMQQSLTQPGSVELAAFEAIVWVLTKLVLLYVVLVVALWFYIKHWVFKWRQAMNDPLTMVALSVMGLSPTLANLKIEVREETRLYAAVELSYAQVRGLLAYLRSALEAREAQPRGTLAPPLPGPPGPGSNPGSLSPSKLKQ